MTNFPKIFQFDLGRYVSQLVDWLVVNLNYFFDAISSGILAFLLTIEDILLWIPWFVVLVLVFLAGWRIKNLKSGIFFAIIIFLIGTLGLWEEMMMTLAIVVTAVIISIIVGIPLGIVMTYSTKLEMILKPILDGMQTMPSFVYLIPALMFFGMGMVPAVFATIIYSTPPAIRLTDLALRRVSKEMKEAAQSFGSSKWQMLTKIELPQAFPTIMAGINQTTMMAMAMVVIASMVGARGLGLVVLTGISRIDVGMGFEAGISIVFLAIIIDRITQGIANRFKYSD